MSVQRPQQFGGQRVGGALTMAFKGTSGILRAKFSAQSVRWVLVCAQSQLLSA